MCSPNFDAFRVKLIIYKSRLLKAVSENREMYLVNLAYGGK